MTEAMYDRQQPLLQLLNKNQAIMETVQAQPRMAQMLLRQQENKFVKAIHLRNRTNTRNRRTAQTEQKGDENHFEHRPATKGEISRWNNRNFTNSMMV